MNIWQSRYGRHRRGRISNSCRVLLVAGIGMAALFGGNAQASTNPDQADGPGIITIEQTNMCMWGSYITPDCFPNSSGSDAVEAAVAAQKRAALAAQIDRHDPDVLTVNEGCLNDVAAVADAAGYQMRYAETGRNTHPCSGGRGASVNAILTKWSFIGSTQKGYFRPAPLTAETVQVSYRSYLCASVRTDQWANVRVCTAHLSLKTQGVFPPELHYAECSQLRSILDASSGYVLFAGDVNSGTDDCAPSRFHGLHDFLTNSDTSGHPGLQQIYYSANGFWRQSCGWAYTVEHTDHKGFLLELGKQAPSSLGPCNRGL